MNSRRVAALLRRQFDLMRTSPARVLPLFAWVAVDMVLWGYIARYVEAIARATHPLLPALLGAVLLWDFFTRVMQGVTMPFFEDVWSRNFVNLFGSPLSLGEYAAGLVAAAVVTSAIGLVVMLLLATSLFGLSFAPLGLRLGAFLLVLFGFGVALGLFGCALVLRYGPAAEWLIWPIPAILSPFVGVFYPLATLPAWMRAIGWCLPPSHVFEGLRALLAGSDMPMEELGLAVALTAVHLLLAGWALRRVFAHARRTGLLARYSAEGVG